MHIWCHIGMLILVFTAIGGYIEETLVVTSMRYLVVISDAYLVVILME